ncbi:MAG: PorT family protein [Dysgonamonadaceae bacterium]|jgi:hypothetical protein|nr:PorT family protein [Dysgonamonadaceae bacterium]
MKKIFLLCLSVLMTTGLVKTNAQTSVSGGMKVEVNMSNFLLSDLNNQSSRMKVGPTLGGFLKVDLHENFAIQPELLFYYRQSKTKVGIEKDDFQQWGMQIPVYAVAQTRLGSGKGYFGVGPYLGIGFDARMDKADINMYKKYDGKKWMNRCDFGLGVMIGYEFDNRVQLNAGYQIGFVDQLDVLKDVASKRTQTVTLGLGYRF